MSDRPQWQASKDLWRLGTIPDFSDLGNIVAAQFEMYTKVCTFISPWNAKQIGAKFPYQAPEKDALLTAVGKPRSCISFITVNGLVDEVHNFCKQHKGMRQLIMPNITTHHSAQFTRALFTIKLANDKIALTHGKSRFPVKSIHEIELFGASSPIHVANLSIPIDQIDTVIIRPKIGKLGTPNLSKWEVLFFTKQRGIKYLINHVDSDLNPRYSGIL